jgi:hypothetical protein
VAAQLPTLLAACLSFVALLLLLLLLALGP